MSPILIVCQNLNIQKFYVTNLVVRGYQAIGVSQLVDQGQAFWDHTQAELAVMWGELPQLEMEVRVLREHSVDHIPVVLVSREKPTSDWLTTWKIAAHTPYLSDSRQLMDFLQPWLKPSAPQTLQTGNHSQQ